MKLGPFIASAILAGGVATSAVAAHQEKYQTEVHIGERGYTITLPTRNAKGRLEIWRDLGDGMDLELADTKYKNLAVMNFARMSSALLLTLHLPYEVSLMASCTTGPCDDAQVNTIVRGGYYLKRGQGDEQLFQKADRVLSHYQHLLEQKGVYERWTKQQYTTNDGLSELLDLALKRFKERPREK